MGQIIPNWSHQFSAKHNDPSYFPYLSSIILLISSRLGQQKIFKKVISKGAVTEVYPCDNESISTVFLFPKKTGDFRPVINLNLLDQFVKNIHLKMENIRMYFPWGLHGLY